MPISRSQTDGNLGSFNAQDDASILALQAQHLVAHEEMYNNGIIAGASGAMESPDGSDCTEDHTLLGSDDGKMDQDLSPINSDDENVINNIMSKDQDFELFQIMVGMMLEGAPSQHFEYVEDGDIGVDEDFENNNLEGRSDTIHGGYFALCQDITSLMLGSTPNQSGHMSSPG